MQRAEVEELVGQAAGKGRILGIRPFEHRVVARETSAALEADYRDAEKAPTIHDLYRALTHDSARNELIKNDVLQCVCTKINKKSGFMTMLTAESRWQSRCTNGDALDTARWAILCPNRMDWYKKQVQFCVRPDLIGRDEVDLERGVALIEQYKVATDDLPGAIDLMLYFVEQGNQFTLDYGDIDSWFYEEMEEMFGKAVRILESHPEQLTDEVKARIRRICDETDGIGWGYHDTLCDLAGRVVPEEQA